MKSLRYRGVVLAGAVVILVAVAAWANVYLLDFNGYDYWWPSNCYNALGDVTDFNPDYLSLDFSTNEYTISLQQICVTSVDSTSFPGMKIFYLEGGTLDIYGDDLVTGTHRDYGTNPPNATAPSTFEDGQLILGGDFSQMTVTWNMMTGEGSLEGVLTFNRGAQLDSIPEAQRDGWTLAALRVTGSEIPTPEGYFWQIDGQVYISDPIPVENSSWGQIKQQYLGGN